MTIILRKATPSDIDGIVDLGLEALEKDAYEELIICPDKVRSIALECISSATNFVYVAEKEGVIVGSVGALVHPMMFYERSQASVVQFYCKEPGYGIKLIRELLTWCDSRPIIKMVCFTLETEADPRIGKMLQRLGLKKALPVYLKMR